MLRKLTIPTLGLALVGATLWQVRRPAVAQSTPAPMTSLGVRADGRVASAPGAEVVVASERGGRIVKLAVEERATVHRGELVAELDAESESAALAEARARAAQAEADARFAEAQLARAQRLGDAVTADAVERATHDRDVAAAQRELTRATVRRLGAELGKTRLVAPIDGVVLVRHAVAGEVVAPGAAIVTIADLARARVSAEVDEFDVARVHAGDEVVITAEGHDGSWRGRVESVPDYVAPRRMRPTDPGRATDTAVLTVAIVPLEPLPLKLGQRAEVEIVAGHAEPVAAEDQSARSMYR